MLHVSPRTSERLSLGSHAETAGHRRPLGLVVLVTRGRVRAALQRHGALAHRRLLPMHADGHRERAGQRFVELGGEHDSYKIPDSRYDRVDTQRAISRIARGFS